MARYVKVSAVAPRPLEMNPQQDLNACVDHMIAHWDSWLEKVLCDAPDLIVLPEACDRPANFTPERLLAYYVVRQNRILDHFRETARTRRCNIAYSAARGMPDGSFRNSIQFINRRGELDGIYNKNHLVTSEFTEAGMLYGREAPIIRTDFGRVAGIICFDLNYQELREKYIRSQPELLVFSSLYHGGLMQPYWAYACRSYFIGSVAGDQCAVIDPQGEPVARSTNYTAYVTADINLDYKIAHFDYNEEKFRAAKRKYGPKLKIRDPGHLGSVLLTSESVEFSMDEVVSEFKIELLDDYFTRSLADRHATGHIEP